MRLKAISALRLLLSYFPSQLPNSPQAVEDWSSDVLALSGYPNNPSFVSALLTQVMHLKDNRVTHMSKQYFAKSIKAAVIRQQVFAAIERIKDEAKAQREQEAAKNGTAESSSPKTPLAD